MRVAGSGTGSAGAGSGNEGNKATKNGGMIWIKFPGVNSPGQAPVEHARGFSALVEHAPGFSGVGEGGVLEPLAPSDFVGKSCEIVEPRKIPGVTGRDFREILGFLHHQTASCTNHGPRTVSCDSAVCED
jgi:hypothetical protein